MSTAPVLTPDHGALMDSVYRKQRHVYDATRKFYLFGRDQLIDGLALPHGGNVLEIGCGTGRNLARIAKRWPGTTLYGLDISAEMLKSASERTSGMARLAQGDATQFDPEALFGAATFDRVVISFALSMIPDWEQALLHAASLLAPGGSLHVVDFGDMKRMPAIIRAPLRRWLTWFHVAPRNDLVRLALAQAARRGLGCRSRIGLGGYYQMVILGRVR
ncbi:class I SAM-dependent methyltransferase [Novosphingobium lentum]|uniref:class I SAM-dependent methyltransferase n=1 Tax=Novosphingobium lentum TaxID=145287 RepID=UPI00082A4675|nr:class I SAM-dependent methyltransferase [Novosphingobium lentum]